MISLRMLILLGIDQMLSRPTLETADPRHIAASSKLVLRLATMRFRLRSATITACG
jgi:hypothetical protein